LITTFNELQVAVGVIKNASGEFLVAKRPPGKPLAGLWEFPGGKINLDETVLQALIRELHEELGIHVTTAKPHLELSYQYEQQTIKLHVWQVESYTGQAQGMEGQDLRWVTLTELQKLPAPSANTLIVESFLF
jgi:8-oxo-dGTP diphosphatase